MKLCDFLHFNQECPICGEPLKLYMQIVDSALWKATPVSAGEYVFEQIKLKEESLLPFMLLDNGNNHNVDFLDETTREQAKSWELFFFVMCNESGIHDEGKEDYYICAYDACYYRSSDYMKFREHVPGQITLEFLKSEEEALINRGEICSIKKAAEDTVEKVYYLDINYEDKLTKLSRYITTDEQRKTSLYEPNSFVSKELALITRPNFDFDSRDKLLSRLDTWILMS